MSAERHFRMSALNGVIALRQYMDGNAGVTPNEAAESLVRIDVDFASSDYRTALELHGKRCFQATALNGCDAA